MDRALIVSSGEKSITFISDILHQASVFDVAAVNTAGEARRLFIENDYDLCIINSPLADESGEALACTLARRGCTEVILIVKSELYDEISEKVENEGVVTVSKPVSREFFWNALKLSMAAHKRLKKAQSENEKLVQRLEDIKIIDRAKCLLISYLSMTEPQAHKYIEKQAMDSRQSKKTIAQEIIKTYDY